MPASDLAQRGHERAGPGIDPLVKSFPRPFAAYRITEEDGEKIDHLVSSEAATGKAHLFFDGGKHPWRWRWCVSNVISPNQAGIEGTDCAEAWMFTGE